MFHTSQPSFSLVGSDVAPIPLSLEDLPETPVGPEKRIAGAAREAWEVICARRAETIAQEGYDPILLVCAVDSQIGRRIVTNRLGDLAPRCLCGPVVFCLNPDTKALAAELGPVSTVILEGLEKIGPKTDEPKLLFAVNGMGLDLRVLRAAADQPVESSPTEPSDPAPAPPSSTSAAPSPAP